MMTIDRCIHGDPCPQLTHLAKTIWMLQLEQYQTLTITWSKQISDEMFWQGDFSELAITVLHLQCSKDCPAGKFMERDVFHPHLLRYACSRQTEQALSQPHYPVLVCFRNALHLVHNIERTIRVQLRATNWIGTGGLIYRMIWTDYRPSEVHPMF